jgi:hypothetical protein
LTEHAEKLTEVLNQTSDAVLNFLDGFYEKLNELDDEDSPFDKVEKEVTLEEKFIYIRNNVTSEMAKGAVRFVEGAVLSGETLEGYSGWIDSVYNKLKEEAEDPNNR